LKTSPEKKAAEVIIPAISEGSGTASARILKENLSRLDSNLIGKARGFFWSITASMPVTLNSETP
jgi:hypothetical protein